MEVHKCNFCERQFACKRSLVKHQIKDHQNDPGFRIDCAKCTYKCKTLEIMKQHLSAAHKSSAEDNILQGGVAGPGASSSIGGEESVLQGDDVTNVTPADVKDVGFYFEEWKDESMNVGVEKDVSLELKLQQEAASFLSSIKNNFSTTQVTIDAIVKGFGGLFSLYNEILKGKVLSRAEDGVINAKLVSEVFEFYKNQSVFEGIETKYWQKKLLKNSKLPYPEVILIVTASKCVLSNGIFKQVPDKFGYAAPFLSQLECLLNQEDILMCIDNPVPSGEGEFRTVLDGQVYKTLASKYPEDSTVLAFVAYMDDVQPGEILSAKGQGHSLRSFSWILANIHPKFRSTLRCIQLLALVEKRHVQQNDPYLQVFLDGMKMLSSDEGVIFTIKGQPRKFHGVLVMWVGDTPASNNMAGFKESPGSAHRPCRQCLVTHDQLFDCFLEDESSLRNAALHQAHLQVILSEDVSFDSEAMEIDTQLSNPSVEFGVNSRSCLLSLSYFDVTKCFPQDIMHVLAEGGALEINSRFLLAEAVQAGLPLQEVNSRIQNFDYGSFKTDQPGPIKSDHLKPNKNLRQSASQMFLLCFLIPIIVRGYCKEDNLKNFVRLLMVTTICLSQVVLKNEVDRLRDLICQYLTNFRRIYGVEKMTPKMHFLIHLPSQILMFGPLTQQWAMRFEAYHAILKRLFKILHNSKNVSFSLSERLLERSFHELQTCEKGKFLFQSHTGQLKEPILIQECPHASIIQTLSLEEDLPLTPGENITFYGVKYSSDDIIQLSSNASIPVFGIVVQLYLHQKGLVLICRELNTVSFDVKLNCYEVSGDASLGLVAICIQESSSVKPLFKVSLDRKVFVISMHNSPIAYTMMEDWIPS